MRYFCTSMSIIAAGLVLFVGPHVHAGNVHTGNVVRPKIGPAVPPANPPPNIKRPPIGPAKGRLHRCYMGGWGHHGPVPMCPD
jgi:hypothetical protein